MINVWVIASFTDLFLWSYRIWNEMSLLRNVKLWSVCFVIVLLPQFHTVI